MLPESSTFGLFRRSEGSGVGEDMVMVVEVEEKVTTKVHIGTCTTNNREAVQLATA